MIKKKDKTKLIMEAATCQGHDASRIAIMKIEEIPLNQIIRRLSLRGFSQRNQHQLNCAILVN